MHSRVVERDRFRYWNHNEIQWKITGNVCDVVKMTGNASEATTCTRARDCENPRFDSRHVTWCTRGKTSRFHGGGPRSRNNVPWRRCSSEGAEPFCARKRTNARERCDLCPRDDGSHTGSANTTMVTARTVIFLLLFRRRLAPQHTDTRRRSRRRVSRRETARASRFTRSRSGPLSAPACRPKKKNTHVVVTITLSHYQSCYSYARTRTRYYTLRRSTNR